jgi:circadian clock protein KaiC
MSERAANTGLRRVPTGVPGLDTVLAGGLLSGGTYIVLGPPGAGKTILANQIAFNQVRDGGRVLYVTLLAESSARMLSLIGSLSFFDPGPIADSLTYLSAYRTLEEEGLDGLITLIRGAIRDHRATMLILDGLVSAEAIAQSELSFKKFIHELHTLVTYVDCTTILLTNESARPVRPEDTMVDGIIELTDQLVGLRAVRELVVRKFRGSSHFRGRHFFDITSDGVRVWPRIEVVLASPPPAPAAFEELMPFDVDGLDNMLGGGLVRGSSTLLFGPSGAGKTLLGLTFLAAGRARRERSMYFGFFESPQRLLAKGHHIGLPLGEMVTEGLLDVEWQPPTDLVADALAMRLLADIRERNIKRLFVDGVTGIVEAAIYRERAVRFFSALTNELRAAGITSLFSDENTPLYGTTADPSIGLSAVMENVLLLRQVEREGIIARELAVLKTRATAHDPAVRPIIITERGYDVAGRGPKRAATKRAGKTAKRKRPR